MPLQRKYFKSKFNRKINKLIRDLGFKGKFKVAALAKREERLYTENENERVGFIRAIDREDLCARYSNTIDHSQS